MKHQRFFALLLSAALILTCVYLPAAAAGEDYGTVTTEGDGTVVLNFGADSITVSGNGEIIEDSTNNVTRPDNLKTDSTGIAVLTMPEVSVSAGGNVTLSAASKNDAKVTVSVGGTAIAVFDNVKNGDWTVPTTHTADITTAASGAVTLTIEGPAKTYCGNYMWVSFTGAQAVVPTIDPNAPTAKPTATPGATADPAALPAYQNESLSFEERAADLVSRMTLEEKITQLGKDAPAIERLGVSAYGYWKEAIHGVARQGKATSFPSSLAMSNTWNRALILKMADITSTEARIKNSRYNLSYYSPTINLARDPRWGRNEETYGEDPYLSSEIGIQFVNGFQGTDDKYIKIIPTIKHFTANNNETNRRGGSSIMTEYNLRNYYTRVFQDVTEKSNPGSVMASYNATSIYRNGSLLYNYKPSSVNPYLLNDLLRRTWGFNGYVTTDCGAGDDWIGNSSYAQGIFGANNASGKTKAEGVAEAYKSGLNIECNLSGGNVSQSNGLEAVEKGYITEQQIEAAIYELFLQRFKTGEFDNTDVYRSYDSALLECDEHVDAAEELAEESWVLLKNDDNTLPIASTAKNIAIVGNYADEVVVGDYSGSPTKNTTSYDGLKNELQKTNPDATLNYIGSVAASTKLMNLKSLTINLTNGKTRVIDLSKVQSTAGMTVEGGILTGITKEGSALLKSVDLTDAASITAELSTDVASPGGSVVVKYGTENGPEVANIKGENTGGTDIYKQYTADYTGTDGGYGGVSDIYLKFTPNVEDFSVAAYKSQLDAADMIIAYAGTTSADSKESTDRSSINLPSHQSHVQAICDAYPDKTVVAMHTVGQINVEPFMNKCKAILWTSYNGQTQGEAFGKILTGQVNPSGRLSTTWYKNDDLAKMKLSDTSTKTIDGISGQYTDYNIQPTGDGTGRTYQYYNGTPVYPFGYGLSYTDFTISNIKIKDGASAVDANGSITFAADVTNTGSVAGKEVVQLYIAHPRENNEYADVSLIPLKQLKGFEKVELAPGETKTVEITLDVADTHLFSEKLQKDFVLNGTYTAYMAADASDITNALNFNVTGELASELNVVKAIPNGVTVTGLICEDGTGLTPKTTIDSQLSAMLSDETELTLNSSNVTYKSADESIATVSDSGIVSSGNTEGVTMITATVSYGGAEKSASFPVVNSLLIKPSADDLAAAEAELKAAYDRLPRTAYSAANLSEIDKIYSDASAAAGNAETKDALTQLVAESINAMNSVPMDNLRDEYTIASENENYIVGGVIDYRDGGIPPYNGATGTVTNDSPYTGIQLIAKDKSGNIIDNSKLTWQIKKFDNSIRKVAEISESGVMTVYGNGIVQVTAADVENMICGTMMIQINMQIEGEYADDSGGANLADNQNGSSGGKDAGSTGDSWIEYKSVKLSNLESFIVRYAGKNAGVINVSLDKNIRNENLIGTASVASTGGWSTWADAKIELKSDVITKAQLDGRLDEYGCATIYVQTNGTNLDYMRLGYTENNDEVPYVITKLLNKANGNIKVTLKYRGSTLPKDVTLKAELQGGSTGDGITGVTVADGNTDVTLSGIASGVVVAARYSSDGSVMTEYRTADVSGDKVTFSGFAADKVMVWDSLENMQPLCEAKEAGADANAVTMTVKGSGEYDLSAGAADGQTVRITVVDDDTVLSESLDHVYHTPVDSKIVAYYLDSKEFNYTVLTGGADETKFADTVNGLSGYGSWALKAKSYDYTYSDVNEKTHTFSFKNTWQAGAGSETKRNLFFTPEKPCKVTVVFNGGTDRNMSIYQDGKALATGIGNGTDQAFSAEITDTSKPVYVWGNGSNKNLYAIIVEYYGGD